MIARGKVDGIEITAGAINFDFIGGSVGAAEGEAIISVFNMQLTIKLHMFSSLVGVAKECSSRLLH